MKLKVLEYLEEMEAWSPDPNPDNITIYCAAVRAEVDGEDVGEVQLKTGSKQSFGKIEEGAEFEVEDKTSNPKYPTFKIKPKPKPGYGGQRQQPTRGRSQQGGSQRSAPQPEPNRDIGMTVGNALNVSAVFHAHREKSTIEEVLRDALKVFGWSRDLQAGKMGTKPKAPPSDDAEEFDKNFPPDDDPPEEM